MSAETTQPTPDEKPTKRKGRRTVAEIEAETTARIEAELRAKLTRELADEKDARIAELEKQLLTKPGPESALGQAQPPTINVEVNTAAPPGSVTVHFVEDGLTVMGKVWYRGEEITVVPGTSEWDLVTDNKGRNILTLSEVEQINRWQKRYFAPGPWPFNSGFELDKTAYIKKTDTGEAYFDKPSYEEDLTKLKRQEEKRAIRASSPGPRAAGKIFS